MNACSYHADIYGGAVAFGYKDLIPYVKAEKFDAEEGASVFKRSGARCVVPVAERRSWNVLFVRSS